MGTSPIRRNAVLSNVDDMTLRDEVRRLLAEPADGDTLALGDLPSELVSTVLATFADTAPIAEADALAPIVMQTSPVPFEVELDGVGTEAVIDPMGELLAIHGVEAADDLDTDAGPSDVDPAALDDSSPTFGEAERATLDDASSDEGATDDDGSQAGVATTEPAATDQDFGSGSAATNTPLGLDDSPTVAVGGGSPGGPDEALDLGLAPVEVADIDFDPMDISREFDTVGGLEDEVEIGTDEGDIVGESFGDVID